MFPYQQQVVDTLARAVAVAVVVVVTVEAEQVDQAYNDYMALLAIAVAWVARHQERPGHIASHSNDIVLPVQVVPAASVEAAVAAVLRFPLFSIS